MVKNKYFLLLALVLIPILWIFLLPGPRAANDFPYAFSDSVKSGFNIPQTWSERSSVNLGEFVLHTLWSWPVDFVYGLGATLGFNFSILERLFGIFPIFILGSWSILRLLDYFGVSDKGKFVGVLIYLLNTYLLSLVDGGQLSIGLAYALMPLVFLTIIKSIDLGSRQRILAGICVFLLGTFDIRFVYILVILLLVYFLYNFAFCYRERLSRLVGWLKVCLAVSVIYLGLSSYWILPSILAKAPTLPVAYTQESQTSFLNFTELKHSISLLQPHWYENVFGKIPPFRKEFLLIPALAFLAPILKRKDKHVWFWVIVAIISVFLTKGANPPFPEIYPWLFTHIPGFSFFRDSTKFFFLVALSYSVLIAVTLDEIAKRLPKFKVVFPFLLTAYLLFLVRPVYLGQMTGIFSEPRHKNEYLSLANKLEEDKDFGRIFWIPGRAHLGFSSPTHSTATALSLADKRPFAIGTVGTYEFLNFLREAPFMGELFDIAGIRYIIYPFPDTRREELKPDNIDYYHAFSDQISKLPWIEKKIFDFPVNVFQAKKSQDHFFIAPNTFYIVGSDRIYWDLVKIPGFELSKNALVFVEEFPEIIKSIPDHAKVVLFEKGLVDFTASLIDKTRFIFPAQNLDRDPDASGWWVRDGSDLIWWRDFLQQKYKIDNLDFDYGGGWAIAEGDRELSINNNQLSKGNKLLARVMTSTKGGKVKFWQGETLIGKIDTKTENLEKVEVRLTGYKEVSDYISEYDKADFAWFEIGKLVSDGELTIKTEGEINVVNSLLSVSKGEWEEAKNEVGRLKAEDRIYDWDDLSMLARTVLVSSSHNNAASLSYQRLSPTHYKVRINGLTSPTTVIFSESFDSLWTFDNKYSTKMYSLVNGFSVEHDGEYDVYFEPQKYVLPGLLISGITLAVLIGFFLYTFISARKN